MARGVKLSNYEKGQIDTRHGQGESNRSIAKQIKRTLSVVNNYLKDPAGYGTKKRNNYKKKLNDRDARQIANTIHGKSINDVREELKLDVSKSTVWRALQTIPQIVQDKLQKQPALKQEHKDRRLAFARAQMAKDWTRVIFSDEKKWNLDGPDGYTHYWRDLRKDPIYFGTRNFGGGSVMCWAAFCADGQVDLQFVSKRMRAQDYTDILDTGLLSFLAQNPQVNYEFQQDNASIHTANHTEEWMTDNGVVSMDWPSRSPDLNPIENLWGILVREVYKNQRQFSSVADLKVAIWLAWNSLDPNVLQNLVSSMPNRIFQVINRSGRITDY